MWSITIFDWLWHWSRPLARWQRKRQRNIDRALLFPAIRAQQKTWEEGAAAILQHVRTDPAWHYTQEWAGEALELEDE